MLFQPASTVPAAAKLDQLGPVPEQTHLSPCKALLPCLGTGGDLGQVLSTECEVLFAGEGTDLQKPEVLAQLSSEIILLSQCSAPSQQLMYQERIQAASYIQPQERAPPCLMLPRVNCTAVSSPLFQAGPAAGWVDIYDAAIIK